MMTYYAQVEDGVVINCIVADAEWQAAQQDGFLYIPYGNSEESNPLAFNPYPGCLYDQETNEFVSPDADAPFVFIVPPEDNAEVEAMLSEILGL